MDNYNEDASGGGPPREESSMFVDQDHDELEVSPGYGYSGSDDPSPQPAIPNHNAVDQDDDGPQNIHQAANNIGVEEGDEVEQQGQNGASAPGGLRDNAGAGQEDGFDSEGSSEGEVEYDPGCQGCTQAVALAEKYARKIKKLQADIATLRQQNAKLEADNQHLRDLLAGSSNTSRGNTSRGNTNRGNTNRRNTNRDGKTWRALWREFIRGNANWAQVWKRMYSEENMPTGLQMHPCIQLVAGNASETMSISSASDSRASSREAAPIAPRSLTKSGHNFDKLPTEALVIILNELLVFERDLIHVFSRLDPHEPPEDKDDIRILNRFFISGRARVAISLTHDTILPNDLLAPLSVCRRWCFFGASIFYSRNTFAFSSFGEFDRFGSGIGGGRVQRLRNIELHWMGGKRVRWTDEKGKSINQGVIPLQWLCETKHLATLVIFIDETGKSVIRRPMERLDVREYEKEVTAGQPNCRESRALRVCQGWDLLHQLRGMQYIRIYDTNRYLKASRFNRKQSAVRDQSAVIDLNRTARMKKVRSRAAEAALHRLDHLVYPVPNKWNPGREDWRAARKIRDSSGSFECRPNNLDVDVAPHEGTPSDWSGPVDDPQSDSDDDSDGDDESDDDDGPDDPSPKPDRPSDGDQRLPTPSSAPNACRRSATLVPIVRDLPEDSSEDELKGEELDGSSVGDCGLSDDDALEEHGLSDDDALEENGLNDVQFRRLRTQQFIREQLSGQHPTPHPPAPREVIDIIDDDELEIIPPPGQGTFGKRASALPRRSTSGLFVTPGPDEERSVTRSVTETASPSVPTKSESCEPPCHIDLTSDSDDEEESQTIKDAVSPQQKNGSPQQNGPQQDANRQESLRQHFLLNGTGTAPASGRPISASPPPPRGVKRSRESSAATSEPNDARKKQLLNTFGHTFGPDANWQWPSKRN